MKWAEKREGNEIYWQAHKKNFTVTIYQHEKTGKPLFAVSIVHKKKDITFNSIGIAGKPDKSYVLFNEAKSFAEMKLDKMINGNYSGCIGSDVMELPIFEDDDDYDPTVTYDGGE